MSTIEVLQAPSAAPMAAPRSGHEKDQPQEHAPERAAQCTFAGAVVQLTCLGLLLAGLPTDHGRVVDSDGRL